MRLTTFLALAGALAIMTPAHLCAATFFDQGVAAFNGGEYPQAVAAFEQQLRTTPQDELTHYYMGVSYHCMGQISEAAREYNWVLMYSHNPELLKRVQSGLQVLARLKPPAGSNPQQAYQIASEPAVTAAAPLQTGMYQQPSDSAPQPHTVAYQQPIDPRYYGGNQYPYGAVAPSAQLSPSAQPLQRPAAIQPNTAQPRIIDLSTSWCGWCKKFAPIFEQAKAKYAGRIAFESLDAEARHNQKLVRKYRIQGYPTLLFFDGGGKLVKRIDGAPQSMEEFEQAILSAFPAAGQ